MSQQFRISLLLPERLVEHHISPDELLSAAGLRPDFFEHPKIYATTAELFAIYRAVGELSPDPAIGLRLGSEPKLERFHPSLVATVCSRNFRDALKRMNRYKQLTCPEEIQVRISGDHAAVEFVYIEAEDPQPDVLVDQAMSWISSIANRGTDGKISPVRLDLKRSAGDRKILEGHFGCEVKFGTGRDALVFRTSDLDRPFTTHNAELLEALGAHLEAQLEAKGNQTNLGERVKRVLKRSLAGVRPTIQDIASELGMSSRTLQRRLGEAEITFQQLVEETRRELARHYLRNSTVDVNGVAFMLGYQDANSFFRAFQTWEGISPGEWRNRLAAEAV